MEAATIFSIIELTTNVIKLGSKIYKEVVGGDNSVDQLKQLNSRLQTLRKTAENISRQVPLRSTFPTEVFNGTNSILITLEECKEFLNGYDAALSGGSGLISAGQRAKYILKLNEKQVKAFHERIDRHYKELDNWQLRALDRKFSAILEIGAIPIPNHGQGDRLLISTDISRSTPPRDINQPIISAGPGNRQQTSRPASASPVLDPTTPPPQAGLISPPPSSQASSPRLQAEYTSPATLLDNFRQDATTSGSSYPPSISEQPDENDIEGWRRNAAPSESSRESRRVTMSIGGRIWTFDHNDYRVVDLEGITLIEWKKPGVRIVHLVEKHTAHIPHSRPYDDECEISFLPLSKPHEFEVIENGYGRVVSAYPRYKFSHKPDREKFQQRFRNRKYLKMIRAAEVRSKTETVAQDIHLKVWREDEFDDEPTISFAHHEKGQPLRQVEYKIRWFKKLAELKNHDRLIIRVYTEERDLDYGPRPEPAGRRLSWGDRFLGHRRSSPGHSRRSSSGGLAVSLLYDNSLSGIVPPDGMQELSYLDIRFSNEAVRESFLNACIEAHSSNARPRHNNAISHGSPSPRLSPTINLSSTFHETANQSFFHNPQYSTPETSEPASGNLLPESAMNGTDQNDLFRGDGSIGD